MENTTTGTLSTLLEKRYSPRSFSNESVDESTLKKIFEAARLAPSSYNEQPWRFIYATKSQTEEYQRLLSCLNEFNQRWAEDAPVLIVGVAKKTFSSNGKVNRHAWYDTGAAVSFMTLKATEEDLYMHQMAGFMPQKAVEVLNIPEGYEPIVMMAMGYLGNSDRPNKERKAVEEIAFKGIWQL
ncbi:nitroreductase [Catalinimonas alkaloidigena]|uniref:nitroreductase family protein n=1 Tax=Catalinimonas alkaloidigena TaxID=1075417 RepID=UPI0024057F3D|nr:nitroreductase family protein [Catalinimonas alkaloidigena]MDF9797619.1 nitroreductase [Catalinimonas alkaloidigena]